MEKAINHNIFVNVLNRTLIFIVTSAIVHNIPLQAQHSSNNRISFITNAGQWESAIKYKVEIAGSVFLLTSSSFVYNFRSEENMTRIHDAMLPDLDKEGINSIDISEEVIRYHAYTVYFKASAGVIIRRNEGFNFR